MPKLRQYLAMLCLFVISLQQGLNIFTSLQLRQHQQQEILQLSKEKKSSISFNFSKAEWQAIQKVNDHEILIGKQLFDISSITTTESAVFIVGHYDAKEDQLNNLAKNLHEPKQKKLLEKQFSFLYTSLAIQQVDEKFIACYHLAVNFPTRNPFLFVTYLQKDTPPPRA